ncbi:MAG: transposase [Rubrivivax sp.]|nr:transposase [Rubrivivax sp.]
MSATSSPVGRNAASEVRGLRCLRPRWSDVGPVGAPVGEDVGVVGLCAEREAVHHHRQRPVDAATQVAGTQRQPDGVDADHRGIACSHEASSTVWAVGQCRVRAVVPACSSIRIEPAADAAGSRAATKPTGLATTGERTIDKHGQALLVPELTVEGWTTSLPDTLDARDIIVLYADHGTHEQFHCEFKTDLDLTRLPSDKFETNYLVYQLAAAAMNILRLTGQRGLLGPDAPVRHSAKRRRIKTVMQELIYRAGRLIQTGRRLSLGLGAYDRAAKVFMRLFAQFAATAWSGAAAAPRPSSDTAGCLASERRVHAAERPQDQALAVRAARAATVGHREALRHAVLQLGPRETAVLGAVQCAADAQEPWPRRHDTLDREDRAQGRRCPRRRVGRSEDQVAGAGLHRCGPARAVPVNGMQERPGVQLQRRPVHAVARPVQEAAHVVVADGEVLQPVPGHVDDVAGDVGAGGRGASGPALAVGRGEDVVAGTDSDELATGPDDAVQRRRGSGRRGHALPGQAVARAQQRRCAAAGAAHCHAGTVGLGQRVQRAHTGGGRLGLRPVHAVGRIHDVARADRQEALSVPQHVVHVEAGVDQRRRHLLPGSGAVATEVDDGACGRAGIGAGVAGSVRVPRAERHEVGHLTVHPAAAAAPARWQVAVAKPVGCALHAEAQRGVDAAHLARDERGLPVEDAALESELRTDVLDVATCGRAQHRDVATAVHRKVVATDRVEAVVVGRQHPLDRSAAEQGGEVGLRECEDPVIADGLYGHRQCSERDDQHQQGTKMHHQSPGSEAFGGESSGFAAPVCTRECGCHALAACLRRLETCPAAGSSDPLCRSSCGRRRPLRCRAPCA